MPSSETLFGSNLTKHHPNVKRITPRWRAVPLEPEQCALIVVDMQEKLLPPIWEKERLVRNVQLLIRLAGILKIPSLVTMQYAKGLGNTVPEIASPCCPTLPPSTN